MSSIFDPQTLLDTEITEVSEERPPLPVGDYRAVIGEVTAANWQSRDGLRSGVKWNVPLTLEIPPEVAEEMGMSDMTELKLTDSIMLDLTPAGSIDMTRGKNVRMRLYREALDMNKPGDSFSPRKMQGQVILVHVDHREHEGRIMENPTRVTRLS